MPKKAGRGVEGKFPGLKMTRADFVVFGEFNNLGGREIKPEVCAQLRRTKASTLNLQGHP